MVYIHLFVTFCFIYLSMYWTRWSFTREVCTKVKYYQFTKLKIRKISCNFLPAKFSNFQIGWKREIKFLHWISIRFRFGSFLLPWLSFDTFLARPVKKDLKWLINYLTALNKRPVFTCARANGNRPVIQKMFMNWGRLEIFWLGTLLCRMVHSENSP